jgi:hypothetical protein
MEGEWYWHLIRDKRRTIIREAGSEMRQGQAVSRANIDIKDTGSRRERVSSSSLGHVGADVPGRKQRIAFAVQLPIIAEVMHAKVVLP